MKSLGTTKNILFVLVGVFAGVLGNLSAAQADPIRFRCAGLFSETSEASPYQQAAAFLATPRNGSGDVSYARQISPKELTSLEHFAYGNAFRGSFFTGTYRGGKVFMKSKFRDNLSERKRPEAAWFMFLNMLGLGPKFHGVTTINGKTYLVIEFVEGATSKFVGESGPEMRLTHSLIEEMKRQLTVLESFRIFASDAQFVFRKNGEVTMLDPELFTIIPSNDVKTMREVQIEHRYQINAIRLDWYKAGKLADD